MKGLTILKREELHLIRWFSLAFLIKLNIWSTACIVCRIFSVEERTRIVFTLFLINRTKRREKKYLFGIIGVCLAKSEEEMNQEWYQIDDDAFSFGTHSGIFF